jgi:hypothetical protein
MPGILKNPVTVISAAKKPTSATSFARRSNGILLPISFLLLYRGTSQLSTENGL